MSMFFLNDKVISGILLMSLSIANFATLLFCCIYDVLRYNIVTNDCVKHGNGIITSYVGGFRYRSLLNLAAFSFLVWFTIFGYDMIITPFCYPKIVSFLSHNPLLV